MTETQLSIWTPTLISIAESQLDVREIGGNNKGADVEKYLKFVHAAPGSPWCMAFVQWCVHETMMQLNLAFTFPRTAGVLDLRNKMRSAFVQEPTVGSIMIMQSGTSGNGHTGIVTAVHQNTVETIEGNTGPDGGRDGDGVYRKTRTLKGNPSKLHIIGFIDFAKFEALPT